MKKAPRETRLTLSPSEADDRPHHHHPLPPHAVRDRGRRFEGVRHSKESTACNVTPDIAESRFKEQGQGTGPILYRAGIGSKQNIPIAPCLIKIVNDRSVNVTWVKMDNVRGTRHRRDQNCLRSRSNAYAPKNMPPTRPMLRTAPTAMTTSTNFSPVPPLTPEFLVNWVL